MPSISKELGLPLRFPGKPGAYDTLIEMTDAGLLAKATVWAATDERCANQAFNINNGDLFRWNDMWPKIARFFELEVAPPLPMSLDVVMADKQPLWDDDGPPARARAYRLQGRVVLGASATSCSRGTTTSSPTAARHGASASTNSSTAKRCCSAFSPISAAARSSPEPIPPLIRKRKAMPLVHYALTAGAFGIGVTEFVIMDLPIEVSDDLGVSIAAAGMLIPWPAASKRCRPSLQCSTNSPLTLRHSFGAISRLCV